MEDGAEGRSEGEVFDTIVDEYDRHRLGYAKALVDRACEVARLGPGAAVLEIGCGTGQLTRSLLERGLRVTAVEPGAQLIARARIGLEGAGEVEFVNARLERRRCRAHIVDSTAEQSIDRRTPSRCAPDSALMMQAAAPPPRSAGAAFALRDR